MHKKTSTFTFHNIAVFNLDNYINIVV